MACAAAAEAFKTWKNTGATPLACGNTVILKGSENCPRTHQLIIEAFQGDAELEAAVNGAIFGAFANSGQICMSTERVVCDRRIADDFAAIFVKKAKSLPFGDPRKPEPVVLTGSRPRCSARTRRAPLRWRGGLNPASAT